MGCYTIINIEDVEFYLDGVRMPNPFETKQGLPPRADIEEKEPTEADEDDPGI